MPSYSKGDVVLVSYPFSDALDFKVRPAIAVSAPHISQDIFIVPVTSRTGNLLVGEFLMKNWKEAGLNVASAVKRGLFTIHQSLVIKKTGSVSQQDADELERSLRIWLGL